MLDIVLVHSDGSDLEIIDNCGTLETLADMKREGKLRAFGMSTKTPEGGLRAARLCDCVMVTWNLDYDGDRPVIDDCYERGVGVLIKKALASGHAAVADGDPVRTTFARLFAHAGVSSAIVGTINPEHLRANVATVEAVAGTPDPL